MSRSTACCDSPDSLSDPTLISAASQRVPSKISNTFFTIRVSGIAINAPRPPNKVVQKMKETKTNSGESYKPLPIIRGWTMFWTPPLITTYATKAMIACGSPYWA